MVLLFTGKLSMAQVNAEEMATPPEIIDSSCIADYTDLLTTRLFLLFQNIQNLQDQFY